MKKIPLTRGLFALVDDEDYEWLSQWKWHVHTKGYAVRGFCRGGRQRSTCMHREIMKPAPGLAVDHINANKLDNRRGNLRVCTRSENARNRGKQTNNTSGFKGVRRHVRRDLQRPWMTQIRVRRKLIHVGCFASPEEAARAYDAAAIKYHGEFARLNFPTNT